MAIIFIDGFDNYMATPPKGTKIEISEDPTDADSWVDISQIQQHMQVAHNRMMAASQYPYLKQAMQNHLNRIPFVQTITIGDDDNGNDRGAGAPAHSNSDDGASASPGGTDADSTVDVSNLTWTFVAGEEPKQEPKPIPHAGIRAGEITAHRMWWLLKDGLSSLAHRRIWQPGETIEGDVDAVIERRWYSDPIPAGVYAFEEFGQAYLELSDYLRWADSWKRKKEDIRHHRSQYQYTWVDSSGGVLQEIPMSHWLKGTPLTDEEVQAQVDLYNKMTGWEGASESDTIVCGRVKLWGEVVEHELGYRAQYAKITDLDCIFSNTKYETSNNRPDLHNLLRKLRVQYGVSGDVVDLWAWENLTRGIGIT